jgi:hypothetical protein
MNALETDDRCKVLVLTGAGDSFCAGMDLKEFFRDNDHLSPNERAHIYRTNAAWQWRQFQFYPKPTIALMMAGGNSAERIPIAIDDPDKLFFYTFAPLRKNLHSTPIDARLSSTHNPLNPSDSNRCRSNCNLLRTCLPRSKML